MDLLSIPDGIAPGAYYLIACADDPGTVMAIIQTNNCSVTDSQRSRGSECTSCTTKACGFYAL